MTQEQEHLQLDCPVCPAKKGEPCRDLRKGKRHGQPIRTFHPQRTTDYQRYAEGVDSYLNSIEEST